MRRGTALRASQTARGVVKFRETIGGSGRRLDSIDFIKNIIELEDYKELYILGTTGNGKNEISKLR